MQIEPTAPGTLVPTTETALEAPVERGEEFRDKPPLQLSTQGARKTLTRDELAYFTRLSFAHSVWSLAQTVILIGATLALGLYGFSIAFSAISPKPLVGAPLLVVAIVLMGCWQHWLAIISHESTHYRLFESRAANDWVGRFAGMSIGVSTFAYRIVHRLHHNHLYEEIDPDMALMAGYPRGKSYLWKKLLKDIAGFTAWRNYLYSSARPLPTPSPDRSRIRLPIPRRICANWRCRIAGWWWVFMC